MESCNALPRRVASAAPGEQSLRYPGALLTPSAVRRWCTSRVDSWPLERREDIALVVSELVTNSVKHSRSGVPGGTVTITTVRREDALTVRVLDEGPPEGAPALPTMREPDPIEGTGRGLRLVDSFATRWGACRHPDGTTEVWARFERLEKAHRPL